MRRRGLNSHREECNEEAILRGLLRYARNDKECHCEERSDEAIS